MPLAVAPALACVVVCPRIVGQAQSDVTDADLVALSTRTVALGAAGGGQIGDVPLEVYVARVLRAKASRTRPTPRSRRWRSRSAPMPLFNIGRHKRDGFDLCDSTSLPGAAVGSARQRARAALATAGRILTYKGAPAEIFYSASCGGTIRGRLRRVAEDRVTLPYLRSVKDDVHDEDMPWTLEKSLAELQADLERNGFQGRLKNVEIKSRNESGPGRGRQALGDAVQIESPA